MTNGTDDLDDNWRDRAVQIAGGAAGVVPFVGGALGEIVNQIVPSQRLDRIVTYLRKLEARVAELEQTNFTEAAKNEEAVDLIERGGYAAANATNSQRIDYIVELVARSIPLPSTDAIRKKRLLNLLNQTDDEEILILKARAGSYDRDRAEDPWSQIDRPRPTHLQSTRDEHDEQNLYRLGEQRLLALGLLREVFPSVKKGQLPEFDHLKKEFKKRIEISYLGRLLLRELGFNVT